MRSPGLREFVATLTHASLEQTSAMPAVSNLSIVPAIQLFLLAIAITPVQANPFACEIPKADIQASQADVGIAKGELEIDGKKVALTQAYAIAIDPIWEGSRTSASHTNNQPGWTVLLTDQRVTDDVLQDFWLGKGISPQKVVDGQIKGLLLTLKQPQRYNITFLYPPPNGWGLSSTSDGIEPQRIQISQSQIRGTVSGSAPLVQTFNYQFSFQTPIRPSPFASRVFTGESALNSSPVSTYLAYLDAIQQKSLEQMRRHLKDVSWQSINQRVSAIGETKFFAELQSYLKDLPRDRATFNRQLHQVVIRGSEAKIFLSVDPQKTQGNGTTSVSLSCENGDWKL